MFDSLKRKCNRIALRACVVIIACFVAEHAAGAYAVHTGLIQGQFKAPAVAFGGYDAAKEQQLAMLTGAVDEWQLKPQQVKPVAAVAADPKPSRKPTQVKAAVR